MPLTKQYRRFVPDSSFGVIGSGQPGIKRFSDKDFRLLTAKCEDLLVWNAKTGQKIKEWKGDQHQVKNEIEIKWFLL